MRCPWCGASPVTIHGDWWECGWCGDSGKLPRSAVSPPATVPVSLTVEYHVDLPEAWASLKTALETLAPSKATALTPLLGRTLLYEISAGIRRGSGPPDAQRQQELEQFLRKTPGLGLDTPAESILNAVRSGTLYRQEGALSKEFCGTFWRELLAALKPEQYYGGRPEGLSALLYELGYAYAYFDDTSKNKFDAALERKDALIDAFYSHWQERVLLHPDAARAKQLLASGVLPKDQDICRDILVTEFPEEAAAYALDDLEDTAWEDLLEDVFERDAPKGIRMWCALLDIAAPYLVFDPALSEALLPGWNVLNAPSPHTAEAFLDALADESFARQVFQSAYIHDLQCDLLALCRTFGRPELGQHCLELALDNPFLDDAWELELALSPLACRPDPRPQPRSVPVPPPEDLPDDGTLFRYCTVRLQGVRRVYSYLTGDLPLKVGDRVEVPFGKEDRPRAGQVTSVTDCTRLSAPWPPEQTKTVLRVVDAPIVSEKKPVLSAPTPTSKPTPEPIERQEVSPEAAPKPAAASPHIQAPEPSIRTEERAQAAKESDTENTEKNAFSEGSTPQSVSDAAPLPKRRFPWKRAFGILVVLVCITCIGMFAYSRRSQLDREYEYAVTLAKSGSYADAKAHFDALGGYHDAESLSVYCQYAEMYTACETYVGGVSELSRLKLKHSPELQSDLTTLLNHVSILAYQKRLEESRMEAAREQAEEIETYAEKLPVDGMPYRCLSLTSLGFPDKTEYCLFYHDLEVHRRFKIHSWHNSEGQLIASCYSSLPKGEEEEVIYSFTYYDPPIGRPNSAPPWTPPFGTSDGSDPYDIEDYDNAEDFYWGNRSCFDSIDDAEMYFKNHKN